MLRSFSRARLSRTRTAPGDVPTIRAISSGGQVLIVEQHHRLPLVLWQGLHRLPKGIVPRLPARYCRFRGQIIQRDCPGLAVGQRRRASLAVIFSSHRGSFSFSRS